ncbi:3'-5' exonuclease [Salibacterium aidingense]|uniref:3'-5' exonuclease n=1 Tax=Salibacterium aidingense TaxID=384933 RepID=UPI0003FCF61C|nr:3'-5' exonuclease [Salibacterium aidingense]
MNFTAIDFETAKPSRASVCAVGLLEYQDGEKVEEFYRLLKPWDEQFDPWHTSIHGITYEDVEDADAFDVLWEEELEHRLLDKLVVAHHASFDMSVLRHALDVYDIPYPEITYNCTVNIAKKTWGGLLNYKLHTVAEHLSIIFSHHYALEDARASAEVFMHAWKQHEAVSLEVFLEKTNLTNGKKKAGGYWICVKKVDTFFYDLSVIKRNGRRLFFPPVRIDDAAEASSSNRLTHPLYHLERWLRKKALSCLH